MAEIRINRAPVLALWATVVAKRLGFSEPEALTLGKVITGLTAQAKGRRLGIYEPRPPEERAKVSRKREERGVEWLEFMGRMVPVIRTEEGIRAVSGASPVSPESARRYLKSKFGEHLPLVERKLTELAETFEPEELAEEAMKVYMQIRPEVPKGRAGWGKTGVLDLDNIDRLISWRRKVRGREQADRGA